ncbi:MULTISPECIES: SDR family NAD(P)-dependent oxidoreductase [Amycolatopsis]|uniref:SDR family NAD(P)-dependent oxidoreductase n=1 Tax=Amycolatopsis TaxID=1813 RepID=UPI000B8B3BBB|nr:MULTISPECIES: SDR family oxidoreductase [Amycolatopsis]OXM74739.1 3-oxoacyl-ACP reductase [Amycolatopsis sp. KNN50.9b]
MPADVALVTGASRGLGAAVARRLARDGFAVAVNYRSDHDGAGEVVAEIAETGGRAAAFAADVTDPAEVDRLISAVEHGLGPVAVLVCNATGPQPDTAVSDLDWPDYLAHLEFFVKSPVLLQRRVLPGMKARGGGRIIHIGAESERTAPAGAAAYVTAKSAQLGLARAAAKELAAWRITVNTVAPGWVPVERHAGVDRTAYLAGVPLGRLGEPDDVAAAVSYLASDDARFVTGVRLSVSGGAVTD